MKITKRQLKRIIKEELKKTIVKSTARRGATYHVPTSDGPFAGPGTACRCQVPGGPDVPCRCGMPWKSPSRPDVAQQKYTEQEVGEMLADILNLSSDERPLVYNLDTLGELAMKIKNAAMDEPAEYQSLQGGDEMANIR